MKKDDYAKRLDAAKRRLRVHYARVGDDATDEEKRVAFDEAVKADPDLLLPFMHYLRPKH
jgi:hypothetical protein